MSSGWRVFVDDLASHNLCIDKSKLKMCLKLACDIDLDLGKTEPAAADQILTKRFLHSCSIAVCINLGFA